MPFTITHQSSKQIATARKLRRHMTPSEALLWEALRNRKCAGLKFRRQVPLGQFITDFCCLEKKLVIELDGSVHAETQEYDALRTQYLEEKGFTVLRFENNAVQNDIRSVLQSISTEAALSHTKNNATLPT